MCKRWNELTRDQYLWRAICERHLPNVIKPKEKSWEWLYMAKKVLLKVRANPDLTLSNAMIQTPGQHSGVGVYTWENGDPSRASGMYVYHPPPTPLVTDPLTFSLKDGKRHGLGVGPNGRNGRNYDGQWKEGKVHGFGVHTWSRGDKTQGQWSGGRMTGRSGLYAWPEGDS